MSGLQRTDPGFQVGGGLRPTASSYVERPADRELLTALRAGTLCYVLNSRQMGKSSLRIRTMDRLRRPEDNFLCLTVDFQGLAERDMSPDRLFVSILEEIANELPDLDTDVNAWWSAQNPGLSAPARFRRFCTEVLLTRTSRPTVLFFEEIDSLIRAGACRDEFFATLRVLHEARPDHPELRRLNFVLIGVAAPAELVSDPQITPFNVGRPVDLGELPEAETLAALAPGLAAWAGRPEDVVRAVLAWTGGQPFLTQALCDHLARTGEPIPPGRETERVDALAGDWVRRPSEYPSVQQHLETIRQRLLETPTGRTPEMLALYQRVLAGEAIPASANPAVLELRLTGLVLEREGRLTPFNRLYAEVFHADWTADTLAALCPYTESLRAWLASERRDSNPLLRGERLREARAWQVGKALPAEHQEFLEAGERIYLQELAQADRVRAEAARAAQETAEEAERQAERTTRRARRSLVGAVVVSLLFVLGAGLAALQAKDAKNDAGQRIRQAGARVQAADRRVADADRRVADADRRQSEADGRTAVAETRETEAARKVTAASEKLRLAENAAAAAVKEAAAAGKQSAAAIREARAAETARAQAATATTRAKEDLAEAHRATYFEKMALIQQLWDSPPIDQTRITELVGQTASHPNRGFEWGLWNRVAAPPQVLRGHEADEDGDKWVQAVAVSGDGQRVVSGGSDGTVRVWDGASGQARLTLRGHEADKGGRKSVLAVAVSGDGQRVVSGGSDGTVRVWDGASGQARLTLRDHEDLVQAVAVSGDGQRVVSGGSDGTVRVWDGGPGKGEAARKGPGRGGGVRRGRAVGPRGRQVP